MRSHGKTLRQLTASSTTINSLLAYLENAWISIVEERYEVEKMRSTAVENLIQYLNEDPEEKPSWRTDNNKIDMEGALLLLLMTGASEPGVAEWISRSFASLVYTLEYRSDRSKLPRNGRRGY